MDEYLINAGLQRSRHPCEYLGKVSLKGKGEVDMYCVTPSNSS